MLLMDNVNPKPWNKLRLRVRVLGITNDEVETPWSVSACELAALPVQKTAKQPAKISQTSSFSLPPQPPPPLSSIPLKVSPSPSESALISQYELQPFQISQWNPIKSMKRRSPNRLIGRLSTTILTPVASSTYRLSS